MLRKIINIDEELCDGCGLCIPACAEGALKIIDGKAKMISDKYCDGLGACMGDCPKGALTIEERDAEEFDEVAVEEYLSTLQNNEEKTLPCGCPSSKIQTFKSADSCCENIEKYDSAVTNWPIKIKLIPADAPFLKNADLLIMADCSPAVFPDMHKNMLKGKILMIGCPKFDDAAAYIEKFKLIFENSDIKNITLAIMEVPCCSGFSFIVEKGLTKAGKNIPVNKIIINHRGKIISKL